MTYSPYPIANYHTGMDRSLPPWLLPDDAYVEITNGLTRRGAIAKRAGYEPFGQFTQFQTVKEPIITAFTPGQTTVITVPNHQIIEGTLGQITGMDLVNLPGGPTYSLHVVDQDHIELQTLDKESLNSQNSTSYQSGGVLHACNGMAQLQSGTSTTLTTLYPHGLANGQRILLQMCQGITQLNGLLLTCQVIDSVNVKVFYMGGQDVDSSDFGQLTGAGALAVESPQQIKAFATSFDQEGDEVLIVCGKTRICFFDETQGSLIPITFYDAYLADLVINTCAFNKKIWLAGFGIALQAIDIASKISALFQPSYGPGAQDLITGANGIFSFGGRLLLFCPTLTGADGGQKRQRMLFSCQLAPDNQTVPFGAMDFRVDLPGYGGYLDFDCDETFVGVAEVKSALIVYFNKSIYRVRETPKASQPFVVEKVEHLRAAAGPKAIISYEQTAASLGQEALLATDGNNFQRLDQKIPLWLQSEIDQSDFSGVSASRDEINRQVIWTYPEDESYQALVMSEDDVSFSRYTFSIGILGNYLTRDTSPAWLSYDGIKLPQDTWDDHDEPFNSSQLQERVPIMIGGDDFGTIFQLNQGNSDNGAPIKLSLKTKELNPFLSSGVKARLGYVDFLVQVDQDSQFTATFYADSSQNPYLSMTVPCWAQMGPSRSLKRVFKRVFCNQSANFHTIVIEQNGSIGTFILEGMIPYFAQTSARVTL